MKTHFREAYQDMARFFKGTAADIKKLKQNYPEAFLGILALLVLIILGGVSIVLIKSFGSPFSAERSFAMPTVLAVAPQATAVLVSTPTPLPTSTPLPSNLWTVNKHLDPVNGALVVEFKNTSTGESKNAICQSPNDPEPPENTVYMAEAKDGYILLSPTIPGTSQIDFNSKLQRFIFIP